jgi:cytochrome P450
MSRDVMRAFMMGMITGFVPTNIVSAGHIVETLLDRVDFLVAARDAAASGDDDLLSRCLFEAMRFRPLNPGQWRVCLRDCTLARGTSRERRLSKGTHVLASTQSAMFDPRHVRNPRRFDPLRAASDSLLFGYGLHWCVGRFLADAQITQTLKALVGRTNLRRAKGPAGTLRKLALFPEHLHVEFDP